MALLSTAILYGAAASIPSDNTALTEGRLYISSDTAEISRDNGSTWDTVSTGGGGGGGNSAPQGHLVGFEVDVLTSGGTDITLGSGVCRSDADDYTMVKTSPLTIDASSTGAGKLDTGSIANNTWYYIWVIAKSSDGTTSAIASISSTAPTLPSGYNKKRRVGCSRTNSSGKFWAQKTIPGGGNKRHVKYLEDNTYNSADFTILIDANVSTSPTYDDVDCSSLVPPTSRWVDMLNATGTGFASAGSMFWREKGGVTGQRSTIIFFGTAGVGYENIFPLNSSQVGQVSCVNANTEHYHATVMGYVEDVAPAITGVSGI